MKEERLWLQDWRDIEHIHRALEAWMGRYNALRPHQALDWQTPDERGAERLGEVRAAA